MPTPQPSQSTHRPIAPTDAVTARTDFQQLDHEIGTFKEIIWARFDTIVTRLEAMDKAVGLFKDDLVRVPTDVDRQVGALKELIFAKLDAMDRVVLLLNDKSKTILGKEEVDRGLAHLQEICDEKFTSIAIQFRERDVRTESSAKDQKVAVDAALQAAKEAVGKQQESNSLAISKSETSVKEQIAQIGEYMAAENKSTTDKVDDLKQRMTVIEGRTIGRSEQAKGTGEVIGYIIGGMGVIAAIVVGLLAVFLHKP